jgi:hypothetical protein
MWCVVCVRVCVYERVRVRRTSRKRRCAYVSVVLVGILVVQRVCCGLLLWPLGRPYECQACDDIRMTFVGGKCECGPGLVRLECFSCSVHRQCCGLCALACFCFVPSGTILKHAVLPFLPRVGVLPPGRVWLGKPRQSDLHLIGAGMRGDI